MKRKKYTIIIFLLSIFSALVAFIIGIIYYVSIYKWTLASLAFTLHNVITCFAFVPSLSATDVMDWIMSDGEPSAKAFVGNGAEYTFVVYMAYIYAATILIAPICTASALYVFIARLLRQIKWKIKPLFWKKPSEKIMIIGSGKTAFDLINSEKNKSPGREIFFASSKLRNVDEELDLMKGKVRCCDIDLVKCSDKDFKVFLNNYQIGAMTAIILCEDSDAANFSLYIRLMELGHDKLTPESLISCKCEDAAMMNLIVNYYDDNKIECIPPKFFSIAKMRADSIINYQALPVCSKDEDMSLLIVGFGTTGQNMLRNMMNLGVSNSQSKLTIHVVDLDMDTKESMFIRNFSTDYCSISGHHCIIEPEQADGTLDIVFHKVDVRSKAFENLLDEGDVQFASICMENVDSCLDCIQTIGKYIINHDKSEMPIIVSILSDPEITVYLNNDTKRFKNVYFIGEGYYYNINRILTVSIEKNARKFHKAYQDISVVTLKEYHEILEKSEESPDTSWDDTLFYKQEASRLLSQHQVVKNKILKKLKKEHEDFDIERYFGANGSILQNKDTAYTFDISVEKLVEKLNSDPIIRELGMMEHRRWCYCQAVNGWGYTPAEKNEKKKLSPYMVPWDELCRSHPEVCIYDYMAYLIDNKATGQADR